MNFYNANDNYYYVIHPEHIEDYIGRLPNYLPHDRIPGSRPSNNPDPKP